jgi:hypothetical protein
MALSEAVSHYHYAVWLRGKGRLDEAIQHFGGSFCTRKSILEPDGTCWRFP